MERIKELDRYIQKVGKIVTSIEYVIHQKPWNRQDYQNFKERFQNEVNALLSTPPPMSPAELKNTVYELTKTHPENLKKTYPWYKLKMYNNNMPYYSMTEYGRDILESHWSSNICRKIGIYFCCTYKLELKARKEKSFIIEWFNDDDRDNDLENGNNEFQYKKQVSERIENLPVGLHNRYKLNKKCMRFFKAPAKLINCRSIHSKCIIGFIVFCLFIIYLIWTPLMILFFIIESIRDCLMPCFIPEYNIFLYPENYNLLIERQMRFKRIKEEINILGPINNKFNRNKNNRINNNEALFTFYNPSTQYISVDKKKISELEQKNKKLQAESDIREKFLHDTLEKLKKHEPVLNTSIELEIEENERKQQVKKILKEIRKRDRIKKIEEEKIEKEQADIKKNEKNLINRRNN